jgi:hypothetical protein
MLDPIVKINFNDVDQCITTNHINSQSCILDPTVKINFNDVDQCGGSV